MSNMIAGILEDFLGDAYAHNRDTGQMEFDCPACAMDKGMPRGDGKHNLAVNYDKGVFKCWSCYLTNNMHGSILRLINRYGTPKHEQQYKLLKPITTFDGNTKEISDLKLPEGFKKLSEAKSTYFKYNNAINYLQRRGIGMDLIEEFNIGFTTTGRFFNRIIIPSYDSLGELNYFIARSFDFKTKPKYLNPDAEKQDIIFNELKVNWDATIYLVEGAFDHIVVPNSIPLLGKFVSDKLKMLLYSKARANIVILLDDDAYDDAVKIYKELNIGDLQGRIRICTPPNGYDPSKIYEKKKEMGISLLIKNRTKKMSDIEVY